MLSTLLCAASLLLASPDEPMPVQESQTGITHGVLATGAETFQINGDGKTVWTYPASTRDGWLLPNGVYLLCMTKSDAYPHGAVIQVDKAGKKLFEFLGSQSEVDCVQPLPDGHMLVTESGRTPRLMEIDSFGKIVMEFPLQCQLDDFHMQTRMARKLPNGHYLVPHLIDKAVKEYDAKGRVVWQAATPNWPFAAIRLTNGNTLITCTRANAVIEVDKDGNTVWQVSNDDLPGAPIKDACGAARLRNGNTVLTSYGANGADEIKLMEITPDKKVVWTLKTGRAHGIHEFQVLTADGKPLPGRQMR